MTTVSVKIMRESTDVQVPSYQTEFSSGLDLHAYIPQPELIAPGTIVLIPTGLRIAVPPGYEAQVRPRSGLALKHGLTVINTPGTIDADYRGEIKIILGNLGREPFELEPHMRIAQLVIAPVVQAQLELVEELPATGRGEGGFGHSGA